MSRLHQTLGLSLLLSLFAAHAAYAQQTVFDVPSTDVLDKGKVYGELDGTAQSTDPLFTYTPRVVVGIGHQMEAGVNFDGLSSPTIGELEVSPTIKWRPWKNDASGWSFYIGDELFFPVRDRMYNVGNYFYAAFAKQWKHGTRITAGAYDFTRNVVATANRAGAQLTFEQSLTSRLTLAAEWYSGNQAYGYVNTGLIYKLTKKLTLYGAYQVGNANVTKGNHQFLWELGYNFN
ncbi:MAG: hypothetical protein WBL50_16315 [Candidatus Acidiferrum sp.]